MSDRLIRTTAKYDSVIRVGCDPDAGMVSLAISYEHKMSDRIDTQMAQLNRSELADLLGALAEVLEALDAA